MYIHHEDDVNAIPGLLVSLLTSVVLSPIARFALSPCLPNDRAAKLYWSVP